MAVPGPALARLCGMGAQVAAGKSEAGSRDMVGIVGAELR
jgi:hypothetical protein